MLADDLERVYVRSLIIAGLIIGVSTSLVVMGYALLKDYLEVLMLALLTSLAIKPLNDCLIASLTAYSVNSFLAFKESWLVRILVGIKGLFSLKNPFKSTSSFHLVLIISSAYVFLSKTSLYKAVLITLCILFVEAFLSLSIDLFCKLIRKTAIPSLAALFSLVRSLVFAILVLVLISIASLMAVSELKERSVELFESLYDLMNFELPLNLLLDKSEGSGTCTVFWMNLLDLVPKEFSVVTELIEDLEESLSEYSLSSGLLTSLYFKHVSHMNKFAFEVVPFLAKHGLFGFVMLLFSLTDFLVKLLVFVTFVQIFLRNDIFNKVKTPLDRASFARQRGAQGRDQQLYHDWCPRPVRKPVQDR